MNSRFTYFLLVAEELNMSRAAERAYISHQGISATIKQLEKEYGVPLFYRTPRLGLTSQGETLVQALRQIQIIEDNLTAMLNDNSKDFRGKMSLGVPQSRYEIIVPDLVSSFKETYPNVVLDVVSDYSRNLERMAANNELDMFISTGAVESPELSSQPLIDESCVLLISEAMLRQYFPELTDEKIDQFRKGVHLKDFEQVPIIQYPPHSRLQHAINCYAEESDIHLRPVFESNHALSFGSLCQRNLGMGIVSYLFTPWIIQLNLNCKRSEYVHAFPLPELPYLKTISLAYRTDRYLTKCHQDLIRLISQTFAHYECTTPRFL